MDFCSFYFTTYCTLEDFSEFLVPELEWLTTAVPDSTTNKTFRG
jgi:hypothetical protein